MYQNVQMVKLVSGDAEIVRARRSGTAHRHGADRLPIASTVRTKRGSSAFDEAQVGEQQQRGVEAVAVERLDEMAKFGVVGVLDDARVHLVGARRATASRCGARPRCTAILARRSQAAQHITLE